MNLYEEYGKACIQAEIANTRVSELKRLIVEDINKNKTENKKEKKDTNK